MYMNVCISTIIRSASSMEDVPKLQALFKSIQEHVPSAVVNTLMTDDGKTVHIIFEMYI